MHAWGRRIRAVAAAGFLWGQATGAATLVNPGFETGDFTGWSTFGQSWRIGVGADAQAGSYGAVNDMLGGDVDQFRGVFQNIAIVGGASYSAGVWLRTVTMDTTESWLEIQWFDNVGGFISQLQSVHTTADQPFTYLSLTNMVAPINAVTVSVRGIVQMHNTSGAPDFSIFDSFDFSGGPVVPEPGTLTLLGGAGAAIAWWRRRRFRGGF